jgi:hypothetical protein
VLHCAATVTLLSQASRKAPGKAALLHSCAELDLAFDKRSEALAFAKKSYKLQVCVCVCPVTHSLPPSLTHSLTD